MNMKQPLEAGVARDACCNATHYREKCAGSVRFNAGNRSANDASALFGKDEGTGIAVPFPACYLTFTLATISFRAGAALKRTVFEALILIVSPVAGLRPVRAAR
jgi:hypothetical protein